MQDFLLLEEKVTKAVFIPQNGLDKGLTSSGVVLKKATGSWIPNPIIETLRDLNITINPGEFCAVVGPVGAGKVYQYF